MTIASTPLVCSRPKPDGRRQVVGDAVMMRAHQRPFVADERHPLRRAQRLLDVRRHRAQHVGRILRPVVAVRAGVGEHPRRAAVRDRRRLGRLLQHKTAGPASRASTVKHTGTFPELPTGRLRRIEHEAALRDRGARLGLLRVARQRRHADERRARLIDERRHHLVDRLARGRRDRVPEIARRGVAVRVRLQIGVHAFPERLRADVALDHAQHRRAFLIRDRVERLVDLRRRVDAGMDRTRGLERVEAERRLILERLVDGDVPVGPPRGERVVGHPGGEPLVQPDVVPPRHRHEIAEPLVRHLVRQNRRDVLARGDRRVFASASRSVSR